MPRPRVAYRPKLTHYPQRVEQERKSPRLFSLLLRPPPSPSITALHHPLRHRPPAPNLIDPETQLHCCPQASAKPPSPPLASSQTLHLFTMFGAKPPGSSMFGTPTHQQSGTGATSGSNFGLGGAGGTPNTSSLFGTPTTSTQPSSGIFGTAPTGPAAGTGSGFFGGTTPAAATTTSVPSTGGIFGAAPAATSAPTTGGIFGGSGSTPAAGITTSTPGSGLFGSAPAPATSIAPSSGLFGQTPAPTAPSSGLFGSTPAPSATTSGPGFSLLSNVGSTSAGTQPNQQKSLFGSTAPTLSLFAPSTTITNTNNNQQSNQQAPPGGVKVDAYNLAPYHKFHELSDPIRIEIEAAEKYIVSEIQKSESLSAFFPEHRDMVTSVRSDAELMERKLITTNSFLQSDAAALETLVKHQKEDDQHASLSVRTLDLLRLPHASRLIQQQQQSAVAAASGGVPGAGAPAPGGTGQPGFAAEVFGPLPTMSSTSTNESDITSNAAMINYFNRVGSEMEARLQQFSESLGEVEASLRSVEVQAARKLAQRGVIHEVGGNGAQGIDMDQGGRQDDVRRLNRALKEFYEALSDTAVRVVDSKEGLREVKAQVEGRAQGGNIGRSVRR
ncbi:hypothetical protein BGX38DRAFT_1273654 [Terfezia claveryi]|nr:hypothetical protein BGX38DRAFT_1273654 [Terfezia claveryi]